MAYTPYIEAPTVRTVTQPVSGGIDISAFEGQIQGVSARDPLKRAGLGLLPQVGTGEPDFALIQNSFGQPTVRDSENTFYNDRAEFDAVKYLEDPDQFGTPLNFGDYLPKDGALEPLTIRDAAAFTSTEGNNLAHDIRADLMGGNEKAFKGHDRIFHYYEIIKNSNYDFYLDSSSQFANIQLPGELGEGESTNKPFSDTNKSKILLTGDSEINEALLQMTGSVQYSLAPEGFKSSNSGFVYRSEGTDSIAFGGF